MCRRMRMKTRRLREDEDLEEGEYPDEDKDL
jgi:hypothetical protein